MTRLTLSGSWPWFLTRQRLLVAILFIAIFTMAVRVPADSDTWWHLRSGEYMVQNRVIPTVDPFSFTQAGRPWIDHSWLGQLFWVGFYAPGGWPAVTLALALLVTLAFWIIWQQIEANVFVGAAAMTLGAIVSSVVWAARPQMLSFLLTAVVVWLLHRFKRHNRSLLPWLPLVMLLWANIHGGFAIGFILMFITLAGETLNNLTRHQEDAVAGWPRLRHLLLAMLLSLAVVVVNPYTWRMWFYPFQTVGIAALRDFIQEWQSPNFHLPYVQSFAVMLLLVTVALARAGRRADWTDLLMVTVWAGWSLFAARNIAIFGLVVTPVLARYGDLAWLRQWQDWGYQRVPFSGPPAGRRASSSGYRLNWVLLILVLVAALVKVAVPLLPATTQRAEQEGMPYRAVEFIRAERPAGPLFNSYNWGGYLIFKLWPDYPVYIDGRTDLYDDLFIREYLSIISADTGWLEKLNRAGINLVLIENGSTLDKFLQINPDWQELYRDEMAVVFQREILQ